MVSRDFLTIEKLFFQHLSAITENNKNNSSLFNTVANKTINKTPMHKYKQSRPGFQYNQARVFLDVRIDVTFVL